MAKKKKRNIKSEHSSPASTAPYVFIAFYILKLFLTKITGDYVEYKQVRGFEPIFLGS